MKPINVTEKELGAILLQIETKKGMPMFASVLQLTMPKVTKKDRVTKVPNPYNTIHKLSKVSILLNSEYEKAITNQLARENKEASEYKKGENTMPIEFGDNNHFIGTFKGEFVLQYRPNDNSRPETSYLADGKRIEKSEISGFLPVSTPAMNQGTDREILWRKLYLKNVLELTLLGQIYKVIR